MWDYDQRFKVLLDRLTFQIEDMQHREWFIMGLLPHINPANIVEGDYSGRSGENCNALRGYTKRRRDIDEIGTGEIITDQYDDTIVGHGEEKCPAQALMVYQASV
jgi:hypothetical protein